MSPNCLSPVLWCSFNNNHWSITTSDVIDTNRGSGGKPTAGAARKMATAVDLSDESAFAVTWAVHHYLRHGDVFTSSKASHLAQPLIQAQVDEPEKYQSQLSEIVKKGVEADGLEELYKKVHAAIRAYPVTRESEKEAPKQHKRFSLEKLTYDKEG